MNKIEQLAEKLLHSWSPTFTGSLHNCGGHIRDCYITLATCAIAELTPQPRMLEVGERVLPTDEVLINGKWVTFGQTGDYRVQPHVVAPYPVGFYRRPAESAHDVRDAWQKDHMEMKSRLDDAQAQIKPLEEKLAAATSQVLDFSTVIADKEGRLNERDLTVSRLKAKLEQLEAYFHTLPVSDCRKVDEASIERLTHQAANWEQTAEQHFRNECFYRDLIHKIGNMFGIAARIADDGTVQEDVLALRVPELVEQFLVGLEMEHRFNQTQGLD